MYTVIVPILWDEAQFKKRGFFEESKPLINVMGKPMVLKSLESFNSKNFTMNYIFIVNENQLTESLKYYLTPYGKIIEKQASEDLLSVIFNNRYSINDYSKLIIANFCQYINWDFDDVLKYADLYDGCIATFYSRDSNYNYLKVNYENIVTKIKYRHEVSNYASCGIYFFKNFNYFLKIVNPYLQNINIKDIFDIDLIYGDVLNIDKISIYNIPLKNLYLLNTPDEFLTSIDKLKKLRI